MSIVSRNFIICSRVMRSNVFKNTTSLRMWRSQPVLILRCSTCNSNSSEPRQSLKFQEISEFIKNNGRMSDSQVHAVISDLEYGFFSAPSKDYVKIVDKIWNKLENSGSLLTTSHYNTVLKLYMKVSADFIPDSFLLHMLKSNIDRNQETYEIICEELLSTDDTHKLNSVLDFIKKNEMELSEDCIYLIFSKLIQKGDMSTADSILDMLKDICRAEPDRYVRLMHGLLSRKNKKLCDLTLKNWRSDLPFISGLLESLMPTSNPNVLNEILKEIKSNFSYFELEDVFKRLIIKDCPTKPILDLQNALQIGDTLKIIKMQIEARKHPQAIIKFLEDLVEFKQENFQELILFALRSSVIDKHYELCLALLNICQSKGFPTSSLLNHNISKLVDIAGLLKIYKETKCCELHAILSTFQYNISKQNPKVVLQALGSIYDTDSACSITELFLQQGDLENATKYVKYCGKYAPALGMKAVQLLSDHPSITAKAAQLVDFVFASAVQLLWYDQVVGMFISESKSCFLDEDCSIFVPHKGPSTDWTKWGISSGNGREYFGEVLCSVRKLGNEDLLKAFINGFTRYGLGVHRTTVSNMLEFRETTLPTNTLGLLTRTSMSELFIPFHSEVVCDHQSFCLVDRKQWLQENISNHVFSLSELNSILKEVSPGDFSKLTLPSHFELVVRLQYLLTFGYSEDLQERNFTWASEADKSVYTLALCLSMMKKQHPLTLNVLKTLPDLKLSSVVCSFITHYLTDCKNGMTFNKSVEIFERKLPDQGKNSIWWRVLKRDMDGAVRDTVGSLKKSGTSEHLMMLTAALSNQKFSSNSNLTLINLNKLYLACHEAHKRFHDCRSLSKFITVSILCKSTQLLKNKTSLLKAHQDVMNVVVNKCAEFGEDGLKCLALFCFNTRLGEYGISAYTCLLRLYHLTGKEEQAKSFVISVESKHQPHPYFQQEVFMIYGGALELFNRIELLLEKDLVAEAESLLSSVPLTNPLVMRLMMCCFLYDNLKVFKFLKKFSSGSFMYYSDAILVKNKMENQILKKLWNICSCRRTLDSRNEGTLYALVSLIKDKHSSIDELLLKIHEGRIFPLAHLFWKAYICSGNESSAALLESWAKSWNRPVSKTTANFMSYTDVIAETMDLEELETHMYFLEKHNCSAALQRAKILYVLALVVKNDIDKLQAILYTLDGLPLDDVRRLSRSLLLAERTKFRAADYISSILDDNRRWHAKVRS